MRLVIDRQYIIERYLYLGNLMPWIYKFKKDIYLDKNQDLECLGEHIGLKSHLKRRRS